MLKLGDPSLNVYSYTLQKALGVSEITTRKNYQNYLTNLSQQVSDILKLTITDDIKAKFLAITEKPQAELRFTGTLNNHAIEGCYRRRNLEDNYQLLFDAYVEDVYSANQTINLIASLKALMLENQELTTLGKTWMLSAWLESGADAEMEELAKNAYQTIFNSAAEPQAKGKFLGGKVWEFWDTKSQNNHHFLMIFHPNDSVTKKAAVFYEKAWQELFCCRHKIIWGYQNSRELSEELIDSYNQVIEIRGFAELKLTQLQLAMEKLSKFVIDLNYLEFQKSTIKVNLENYDQKLAEIKKKANLLDDLTFLEKFSENAQSKYLRQIEKDLDNFRPCLEILQSLTDTIRGTVEIRQAQSDRTFQTLVGIVGVGLGTGSMVASASANFKEEIANIPVVNTAINIIPLPPSSLKLVLGFSILSGAFASFVTWLVIRWRSR